MIRTFTEHHLLKLLKGYKEQTLPLDLFVATYFKANKALGSKDRAVIAEGVFGFIRWQGLLEYLCGPSASTERCFDYYKSPAFEKAKSDQAVPLHLRSGFPKSLFDLLVNSYGEEKAVELCLVSNRPAPTTVRANLIKITRDALLEKWSSDYDVSPCRHASNGIVFHKKINFFSLPEFKNGLFEVQDEGSQLLADLVDAGPKDLVLDYCAGSGGKTLAFAPKMEGKGQIFLHDVRKFSLGEAKKRLKRAGIQNAQVLMPDDEKKLKKLKKQMTWVLVDAPCSGTGTLRRNPDMKWKFQEEDLKRLTGLQRNIFEKALSFAKPGGHIVYATCSLLQEENEKQVEHFIKTYHLSLEKDPFKSLPSDDGMDGFFAAVFKVPLKEQEG